MTDATRKALTLARRLMEFYRKYEIASTNSPSNHVLCSRLMSACGEAHCRLMDAMKLLSPDELKDYDEEWPRVEAAMLQSFDT